MELSIILASQSPRRKMLLDQMGIPFKAIPPRVKEIVEKETDPEEAAAAISRDKAEWVARSYPRHLVIGADTIVVSEGNLLGKPSSTQDAVATLMLLQGREHQVVTGLSLVHLSGGVCITRTAVTSVRIAPMDVKEIEAYVSTGEPMDKAGAYAIQGIGAAFVESINGCYSNVVGLPLNLLKGMLEQAGWDFWPAVISKKR